MVHADDNIHEALEKIARASAGHARALEVLSGAGIGGVYGALSKPNERNRETNLDRALTYSAIGAGGLPLLSKAIRSGRTAKFRKKKQRFAGDAKATVQSAKAIEQINKEIKAGNPLKVKDLIAERAHFAQKGKDAVKGFDEYTAAKKAIENLNRKYMGLI